jgi:hypothetical protein
MHLHGRIEQDRHHTPEGWRVDHSVLVDQLDPPPEQEEPTAAPTPRGRRRCRTACRSSKAATAASSPARSSRATGSSRPPQARPCSSTSIATRSGARPPRPEIEPAARCRRWRRSTPRSSPWRTTRSRINGVGGSLWTDGWHRGEHTLTVDSIDNGAISTVRLLRGDRELTADRRSCDFTFASRVRKARAA